MDGEETWHIVGGILVGVDYIIPVYMGGAPCMNDFQPFHFVENCVRVYQAICGVCCPIIGCSRLRVRRNFMNGMKAKVNRKLQVLKLVGLENIMKAALG